VFILSLAVISFIFGVQEGRRSQQRAGTQARLSPSFWRWFHWTCTAVIVLAVAFMAWSALTRSMATYSLLVGESVASVFFGLSWLAKGLELDVLLGLGRARRQWERQAAAQTP
jgi:hypothetical protein